MMPGNGCEMVHCGSGRGSAVVPEEGCLQGFHSGLGAVPDSQVREGREVDGRKCQARGGVRVSSRGVDGGGREGSRVREGRETAAVEAQAGGPFRLGRREVRAGGEAGATSGA